MGQKVLGILTVKNDIILKKNMAKIMRIDKACFRLISKQLLFINCKKSQKFSM